MLLHSLNMSTLANISDQTNLALAEKLLEAGWVSQKIGAENVTHWLTEGYKSKEIAPDFFTQLQSLAGSDAVDAIKSLSVEIRDDPSALVDEHGNSVCLEREMQKLKNNAINQEFLTKVAQNYYSQLEQVITGSF